MAKSTRPTIRIHNIETDEIIDREMTNDEFAQYEIDQAKLAAQKIEAETKIAEKQALLDRLGLTADEAKLLLG
jgi:hypothetical protein